MPVKENIKGMPATIVVGATKYKIRLIKNLESDGQDLFGVCHRGKLKEIRIDNSPNSSFNVAETLLHEILHAIWQEFGLTVFKKLDEEQVVNATSIALTTVMMNNPKLNTYFNKQWKTK